MKVNTQDRKTAKISRVVKGDIISENGEFFEVQSYPLIPAVGIARVTLRRVDGTNKTRSRTYDYDADYRVKLVK